ncbi:hypothetical protein NQ317_004593 [Molorchus minor]|uniref:Tyr recombinase domain-containing protein n=1 Tax=Molorchus minor TaxID=1323400 RepID=A0ABQ9JA40_9CUCU|nr:hypothetical protein NQ317_004593 [Molorchus minor]
MMLRKKVPFFVDYVRDTKTHGPKTFTILNTEETVVNYIDIIKKYLNIRPKHVKFQEFFLFYNAGKCTYNPISINTIGLIARNIAKYLNISNIDQYTGHSFPQTSFTILENSGADIRTLKRHGDWKSGTVAEEYVADSLENKNKIDKTLGSPSDVENVNNQIRI